MLIKSYSEFTELEKFIALIKNDCKDYLDLLDNIKDVKTYFSNQRPLFFRGITNENDTFIKKQVRKDRKPLDSTNQVDNVLVDNVFEERMGVRPRSEGLFTTSNAELANKYGELYMIFPIGKFDYVTTNSWIDMIDAWTTYYETFLDYEATGHEDSKEFIDKYGSLENNKVPRKWIEHIMDEYKKNELIEHAAKEGQEVIFICDEYYAIKDESSLYQEIIKWLDNK